MTPISSHIFLGTSGWSYDEWIGPFYSKMDKSKLRVYTKVFTTVEIDSTFYRYPSKGMVMGWARYSPENFVYAAKLPRIITHDKKLSLDKGIEQDVDRFIQVMEPLILNGKLGCILIQLPPKFDFRPEQLEEFFKTLPTHVRFAVEFRENSWMKNETWTLLEKYRVAYAIVDEPLLPPDVHLTSDIAYFRWHGRGDRPWYDYQYSGKELEAWVPKVKQAAEKVEKVFGYFNNHYHGYAVENCLQIMNMMENLNPKQAETKNRIEKYLKDSAEPQANTLAGFITPEMNLESLMTYFVSPERLQRARDIKNEELEIQKQSDGGVEARIRGYRIVIDMKQAIISHDCEDWQRVLANKKFCKHVAKLLLSLEKDSATKILKRIYAEQEKWQFNKLIET